MKYTQTDLQKEPRVILWIPEDAPFDCIIEIQDKDYRFSDEAVNALVEMAEDLILTEHSPERPQVSVGAEPFGAMQTSMVFSGTSSTQKDIIIEKVKDLIKINLFLTPRKNDDN